MAFILLPVVLRGALYVVALCVELKTPGAKAKGRVLTAVMANDDDVLARINVVLALDRLVRAVEAGPCPRLARAVPLDYLL